MAREEAEEILRLRGVTDPVCLLGVRGYLPMDDERGSYNDCIALVTANKFLTFNANTDPNGYRPGHGHAESTKGMATLMPQILRFKLGIHKGKYPALVEAGSVRVLRDADPQVPEHFVIKKGLHRFYEAFGTYGINLHCGSWSSTSSLGCQTIHVAQWPEFIAEVTTVMKANAMNTITYVLVERG